MLAHRALPVLAAAASRRAPVGRQHFHRSVEALAASGAKAAAATAAAPAAAVPPDGQAPPEEAPVRITFGDVSQAAFRIHSGVQRSAMHRSRKLSQMLGATIYCKNEFEHPTGSFKERGSRNALLLLPPEVRRRGVIAASAGNHALALAYHGQELGVPVTVVMPTIAPITKVQNCRDLNARVLIHGAHIGEAREHALKIGQKDGLAYVHGFDDPNVIAGAGTLGLEIVEQVPDVEAVVVPVGGAGLIAGTALAIKTLRPDVLVIGAEPASVPSLSEALKAGKPVNVAAGGTLADGLLVPRVGTNAFELCRQYVDKVVLVKERYIALAMLRLVEMEKAVVEGGGAVGLAAMLQGALPELAGRRVVLPLCGGNVDTPVLGRVLERGMAADGRLVKFEAVVSDRPGGIAGLTKTLAECGVSIKDIYHERAWSQDDIATVRVRCIVESADLSAAQAMVTRLRAAGYEVDLLSKLDAVQTTAPATITGTPSAGVVANAAGAPVAVSLKL